MRAVVRQANQLAEALAFAACAAPKHPSSRILAQVLLSVRGDTLEAAATNLDRVHRVQVALIESDDGITVVPATSLAQLLSKLPKNSPVALTLSGDRLLISAGRGRWWRPTMSTSSFPALLCPCDDAVRFVLPAKTAKRMVRQTMYAVSDEPHRYWLNGVQLRCVDATLRATSTNCKMLTDIPLDSDLDRDVNAIIPTPAIETLAALAALGDIKVMLDHKLVRFTCGAWSMTSKLVDGTYPDVAKVIPPPSNNRVEVSASDLIGAATRLKAVGETDTVIGMRWGTAPQLEVCLARHEDNSEIIDALVHGAGRVAANPTFVIGTIRALGAEEVCIDHAGDTAPIRLTAVSDDAELGVALVMPVAWLKT